MEEAEPHLERSEEAPVVALLGNVQTALVHQLSILLKDWLGSNRLVINYWFIVVLLAQILVVDLLVDVMVEHFVINRRRRGVESR